MQSHAASRGEISEQTHADDSSKHCPRKAYRSLGGALSLQQPGESASALHYKVGALDGSTGTGSLMERPDTDRTSHPNNKNAEMSSAVVFSGRVPQRGVGGSLVRPHVPRD